MCQHFRQHSENSLCCSNSCNCYKVGLFERLTVLNNCVKTYAAVNQIWTHAHTHTHIQTTLHTLLPRR